MLASRKTIHVVAAVIENAAGEILIAKRPQHVHQGGLWEFPGGKVENNETTQTALYREIREELNININDDSPLIQIHHDYPDKSILLDVRHIEAFTGTVIGNEGQEVRWVKKRQLGDFAFPAANRAIIDAIQLPQKYLITPEHKISDRKLFLNTLETRLKTGITLVQLRAKLLSPTEYSTLHHQVNNLALQYKTTLQVNTSIENAIELGARGVHLTSVELLKTKFLPANLFFSASCHNKKEIEKACELGVQFIVLAPVKHTTSHPNTKPLGWENFKQLSFSASMPVYSLGGMRADDIPTTITHGGQGIAAISGLW